MNISSASRVRTLSAPARPRRDSSVSWRVKVSSQAFDMPRMCIRRGSAASRGLNGRRSQPRNPQTNDAVRGPCVAEDDGVGIAGGGDGAAPPARAHPRSLDITWASPWGKTITSPASELDRLLADQPPVAAARR